MYTVSISSNSSFSKDVKKYEKINGTSLDYKDFKFGTVYYIRVSAENKTSYSYWSNVVEFLTILETPEIISPITNSMTEPAMGQIQWDIDEDDNFYHIQISNNESFDSFEVDLKEYHLLTYQYQLEEGITYYARVKKYNDTNSSNWSKTIQFTTIKSGTNVKSGELIEFTFYPNPSQDYLNLSIVNDIFIGQVKVINMLGKTVLESNIIEKDTILDISSLNSGIYYLIIRNKFYKFVKQ